MTIGILREPSFETRVSLLPEHISVFKKPNIRVLVESKCGNTAFATNAQYEKEGAEISSRENILRTCDILLSIHHLTEDDMQYVKNASVILGVYNPLAQASLIKEWAIKGLTTFSMDMLPRTTRAQSMDVLSSQANIAG